MKNAPCVHRFMQARHQGKGRWRCYCPDCGKWLRHIKATGPNVDEASSDTVIVTICNPAGTTVELVSS